MRSAPVSDCYIPPSYSQESGQPSPPLLSRSGSSTPLINGSGEQCSWCCLCFDCNCNCVRRPIPTCVLIMCSFIFLSLAIFVGVLWFVKVPRQWYNSLVDRDASSPNLGGVLVAILALLGLVMLIWTIFRKV